MLYNVTEYYKMLDYGILLASPVRRPWWPLAAAGRAGGGRGQVPDILP